MSSFAVKYYSIEQFVSQNSCRIYFFRVGTFLSNIFLLNIIWLIKFYRKFFWQPIFDEHVFSNNCRRKLLFRFFLFFKKYWVNIVLSNIFYRIFVFRISFTTNICQIELVFRILFYRCRIYCILYIVDYFSSNSFVLNFRSDNFLFKSLFSNDLLK